MKLDDFKTGDGYIYDECHYEDAGELIHIGILEFCGCGNSTDNLRYIMRGLELIAEKCLDMGNWNAWYDEHKKRVDNHFSVDEAAYFFWYWADQEGLTDHGGAVPGWLTGKGKDVLSMLREWAALPETENV
jgi:hypothetical protein